MANPTELQAALKGVDYPASRDDLVKTAERNGADADLLQTLENLPDRTYEDPSEVSQGIADAV